MLFTNDMYLSFCFLCATQCLLWVYLAYIQLFRCRNLTLTRDIFSPFSCQACRKFSGILICVSDWGVSICTLIWLYAPMHLYASCTSVCPLSGHLYIGTSVRHFCVCQYICLPVSPHWSYQLPPHHCWSLLCWTGCLWMYAQLHAVDLFFSL